MLEFLRIQQLNIMMVLIGGCVVISCLLFITRAVSKKRRTILISLELMALMLLSFDRLAYSYQGVSGNVGYIMVRLSNFLVFFLTPGTLFVFNLYLIDLITNEGRMEKVPGSLKFVQAASLLAMALAVISAFSGLYYTFDEYNNYHRGPLFFICYIIPVISPVIQISVIRKCRRHFSKLIFTSLVLYMAVPMAAAVIQIFVYGLSLVNMSVVAVSVLLYFLTYLDINEAVERTHKKEMEDLKEEEERVKRLFDQTASAFAASAEERDEYSRGHSSRVAEYAKKIARLSGKSEDECEKVYYAALLHNVGESALTVSEIEKEEGLDKKTVTGARLLSGITEYPILAEAAHYSSEKYDGSGSPEGLKGNEIPETARIIAVADAYDSMTTKKRYRGPLPAGVIREELVKGAGVQYDPDFSKLMVQLIDSDPSLRENDGSLNDPLENEIECSFYRSRISKGIPVTQNYTEIRFAADPLEGSIYSFSSPAIVLFDSYDGRVHESEKSIKTYHFEEYGEIWFDGHFISTLARNMEVKISDRKGEEDSNIYTVSAVKVGDHLKLKLTDPCCKVRATVALQDSTKSVYIGITGENCHISSITAEQSEKRAGEGDIERIAKEINYIDRMESDIPNVQADRTCSAATEGVKIEDGLRILFHTMSLPTADLVWHCPYIVLYNSDDNRYGGENYREYALIKLNGEDSGSNEYATNRFNMKREDSFEGWEAWKERNKEGLECEIEFLRRGNHITFITENLGISIENVTTILDGSKDVYVCLTGDQCALTDIRIM